ncbi:MAG: ATP-dependent DNA ligase, partial [Bacteroidota bacterium]
HNYFQKNVPRIRYEREKALKLLDASWEDSRQFAMRFFAEQFRQEDWTPELLVSVCDRVRPEIQQFGLQQITQHFQEANGIDYMLKLSQHPNTQLQLFVTNYLTRYAAGNLGRMQKMDYYFTSVLSQVNRGSVAKQRAFTFLGEEAQKDESVAAWVLPLLTRISPTIAITDKTRCIQLMHQLKVQYPSLESPITVVEPKTV